MSSIIEKFKIIKILFFDVDGVLIQKNDGDVNSEDISAFCDEMHDLGLFTVILTARDDDELMSILKGNPNCRVMNASVNKLKGAGEILLEKRINFDEAFFIADDILDLPLMQRVALKTCPPNARREVKRAVDFICKGEGGREILEEIRNYIIESRK